MNKLLTFFIAFLFLSGVGFSQAKTAVWSNSLSAADQLMDEKNDSLNSLNDIAAFINTSFYKEKDKARAVFYWITKNISYSADLLFTYTTSDNPSRVVKDAFENKTAVCIGYAALYDTLCKLTHITSHIVVGSTRQSFLPSVIGHVWNAVMLDSVWYLVDPTWGSGYLQGKNFVRSRNTFYFLAAPERLVATHLPIDPIWQLLKHPLSLYQFHAQLSSTIKTDWNYNDSIAVFLRSPEINKIKSTMRRLQEFGANSEITLNYYNYLRSKEAEYYMQKFNTALKNENEGVSLYNDYINFKNKQFTPVKSDAEIAKIMPAISTRLAVAESTYTQILNQMDDAAFNDGIKANLKQSSDLAGHVKTEQEFVNKYLATKKNKRRDLFYTKIYTLYGVPVK
jgi:hypothetical protein